MDIISTILDFAQGDLSNILPFVFKIVENWWWLPALLIFWKIWREQYLFYKMGKFDLSRPVVLLEIKVPQDVERPIKSMENIFNSLWATYGPPNWKEKWLDGEFEFSHSFEIAGIGGVPHFYIRTRQQYKNLVQSAIYSQYPDAEIEEVEDYTKNVPADIPNKDWNLFGACMQLGSGTKDYLPIVTYKRFFEENLNVPEEKRIDPLASFLDSISTLKPTEQIWIQFIILPVTDDETTFRADAKKFVDKLVKRPEPVKSKPILEEAAQILLTGKATETKKPDEKTSPEMDLTPKDKDILKSVEEKSSKLAFRCSSRFMYIATRDVFFKPVSKLGFSFYNSFAAPHLNGFRLIPGTLTKATYIMKHRKIYQKSRHLFRYYKFRVNQFFPDRGGEFILNSEELATIWHLPSKMAVPAPTLARVAAKKSVAPPNLPVEE